MSEQANLERRYRRLLGYYPRAFRRENEEEIVTVLLACAQEDQQRPGLAASADLIKGAMRARLRPAQGRPRAARIAIRLMCAGVVAEIAHLMTVAMTAGSVRSAVGAAYPGLAAAQHTVTVNLVIDYTVTSIGIAVWMVLTWALMRGSATARGGLAAFCCALILYMLFALSQGSAVYAPADVIAGGTVLLIALTACMLLFTGASGRSYHLQPRAMTPWYGTFGSV
jgi:hypothetical protein